MISRLPATAADQVRAHCAARPPPRRRAASPAGSPARGRTPTGTASAARGRPQASDTSARCTGSCRRCSRCNTEIPARVSRARMRSAGSVEASMAGPVAMTASPLGSSPLASGRAPRRLRPTSSIWKPLRLGRDAEVQRQHCPGAGQQRFERLRRRGSTRRAAPRRSPHAREIACAPPRSAPGSARSWHCCRRPGRGRSR